MTEKSKRIAVRLQAILDRLGWRHSDLARKMNGEVTVKREDRNGNLYETRAARGREMIRLYCQGQRVPGRDKVMAMAKALNVQPWEIDPDLREGVGVAVSEVDRQGFVMLDLSVRVPAHVAQSVRGLLGPWTGQMPGDDDPKQE